MGGTPAEIIANEFISFDARQWIVDIAASDRGFSTSAQCGTWFSMPRSGAQPTIPPGVWLVGSQISPGTYQGSVQADCYWARRRAFTGTVRGDVIANEFISSAGSRLVTVSSSDVGFESNADCGTWTRLSSLTQK